MKSSLFRAIVKKYAGLLLAMLLIPALGCGMMIGMAGGRLSLRTTLDEFIYGHDYPDAVIDTTIRSRSVLEKIRQVSGVEAADARMTGNLTMVDREGRYFSMLAMTFSEKEFQGVSYRERSGREEDLPVILEYRFAKLNHFHTGDPVTLTLGETSYEAVVSDIISRPEMLSPRKLYGMEVPGTDIGYLYVPEKTIEKLKEKTLLKSFCNQFLLKVEEGSKATEVLSKVEELLGKETIKDSYTYETSPVKYAIDNHLDALEVMAWFVPTVLFIIALAVEILFMSFLVRRCRRGIGIIRALGYSRREVVSLFCGINAAVSLAAVFAGLGIGSLMTCVLNAVFRDIFFLPFFVTVLSWKRVLLSTVLCVVVGQIATSFTTLYISRIMPAEAMARPVSTGGKGKGPAAFLGRLSPFAKYCFVSLLRNKARLLFSIVCLLASVAMVFTGFSFWFSKEKSIAEQFEKRIHYDCEIFFFREPEEALLEELTASGLLKEEEVVWYYRRDIEKNGVTKQCLIKGLSPEKTLVSVYDKKEKKLPVSGEGLYLEQHTAAPLGAHPGEVVYIEGVPFTVSEIPLEHENRFQYIAKEAAGALGKPDFFAVLGKMEKEQEIPLMKVLSGKDGYLYAAFTHRVKEGVRVSYHGFDLLVLTILLFAVLIGWLIVTNTFRSNLLDQKKELCVLRALGFQYKDLSRRLLLQAFVYYVPASLIGLFCGVKLARTALAKMQMEIRSYPDVNDPRLYLASLLLVLCCIVFSHFCSMRAMKQWELAEMVNDKE